VRPVLEVLALRAVRRPLLGAAIGRLAPGMMLLSLILSARAAGFSYTSVGLLVAAHQLGAAAASPVQGRLADRLGHARVLVPDALGYLGGAVLLVVGLGRAWPVAALLPLAAATGGMHPPTTACSRALIVRAVLPGRQRAAAFAVSTGTAELGFIVGPLTVVALAASVGPRAALATAGAAAALGALVYASTPDLPAAPPRPASPVSAPTATVLAVLRAPGLGRLVLAFLLVSVGFGASDLFLAAFGEARGRPNLAGPFMAVMAGASLVGGFAYAARVWPGSALLRQRRITAVLGLALLLMPSVGDRIVLLVGALVLVGLSVGPFNVAGFQLAGELAPADGRTEAQGWTQAAIYLGSALGGSLSGALIDLTGPRYAMAAGALTALLGAAVLTGGTRSPRPPSRGSGWRPRRASGSRAVPSPAPAARD
jgi:MFS family permease